MASYNKIKEFIYQGTTVAMLYVDLYDHTKRFNEFKEMISNMQHVQIERIYEAPKEGTLTKEEMIQKTIDNLEGEIGHANDENEKSKEADEQRNRERKEKAKELLKKFAENRKDITKSR